MIGKHRKMDVAIQWVKMEAGLDTLRAVMKTEPIKKMQNARG